MAVPKKKTSPSKRGMRRSHDRATFDRLIDCSHCGELRRPHHLCMECGHYNGRHLMVTKSQKVQAKMAARADEA